MIYYDRPSYGVLCCLLDPFGASIPDTNSTFVKDYHSELADIFAKPLKFKPPNS